MTKYYVNSHKNVNVSYHIHVVMKKMEEELLMCYNYVSASLFPVLRSWCTFHMTFKCVLFPCLNVAISHVLRTCTFDVSSWYR